MTGTQPSADATDTPGKAGRVKRVLLIGVIAVVAIGLLWFTYYKVRGQYYQETNDAYVRADAVTVSPKVAGYVSAVLVQDNQDVKAGQPLLRIDAADYRAQTQQVEAQIAVASANTDNARAAIDEQRAMIDQATAQLNAAEEQARFANAEAARYAPLAASGAESKEKYAQLRTNATNATANASAARASLAVARRRVESLQAQVRQAQAQGQAARAQLDAANVNLGATLIRASIPGVVGNKTVRVGQFVQPGTRLMSVVPVQNLYIEANFKETQIGLMRVGQPVTIHVDALSGIDLHGTVESFSPGTGAQFSLLPPQNAVGNFTKIVQRVPVRIKVNAGAETRKLLVPGLSVNVEVDTIGGRDSVKQIEREQDRLNAERR